MARAMSTALAFLALAFLICAKLTSGAQMARSLKYDYPNPKAPQLHIAPCGHGEHALMMAELQAKDGKDGNRRRLVSVIKGLLHDGHDGRDGHKHDDDKDNTVTNKRGLLHGGADEPDGSGPMVKCSPIAPDNFARVAVTVKEVEAGEAAAPNAAGRK